MSPRDLEPDSLLRHRPQSTQFQQLQPEPQGGGVEVMTGETVSKSKNHIYLYVVTGGVAYLCMGPAMALWAKMDAKERGVEEEKYRLAALTLPFAALAGKAIGETLEWAGIGTIINLGPEQSRMNSKGKIVASFVGGMAAHTLVKTAWERAQGLQKID